jgi:site-specific recombinase XerD
LASKRSTYGRMFKRKGRPGYYVRVRVGDKEVTRWAGPDRRIAGEFIANLHRKTAREELLGDRPISAVSLAEFEPLLLAHFNAHHTPSTVQGETGRLRRLVTWFGKTAMKDISAGDAQDFLTMLRNDEGRSAATVNRYASLLSVAFKLAIQKGYARSNPLMEVTRPREAQKAVPYVSGTDIETLVAQARDARFGSMIRVLGDTGLRRSEVLRLEWKDIDLNRGVLIVRESKNKRPRQVELSQRASDTFRWLREQRVTPLKGPDLVWPEWQSKKPQAVSSRFRTVARRAGFDGLRLHDLRHAFCSRLAQAGVPLPTIAAMAGHSTWVTTQRYASHIPEGATRAAIASMETNERPTAEQRELNG